MARTSCVFFVKLEIFLIKLLTSSLAIFGFLSARDAK
jgi:hypothetical protein